MCKRNKRTINVHQNLRVLACLYLAILQLEQGNPKYITWGLIWDPLQRESSCKMEDNSKELSFSVGEDKTNTEEGEYNFEENLIESVKIFEKVYEQAPKSDPVLQLLREVSEQLLKIQEQELTSENDDMYEDLPEISREDVESLLGFEPDLQTEHLTELTVCEICGANYHITDFM